MKRNGDSKHPCLTPVLISKFFVSWPSWRTLMTFPHMSFWSRWPISWAPHNVVIFSKVSPYPDCQRLSRSQQSWRIVTSSIRSIVLLLSAMLQSGQYTICPGCLKPAWSSRKVLSTSPFICSRIILFNTFPGTDNKVIPLKLSQRLRSPFLGILIR